ncbi:hypothetical protein V2J09_014782 [Rumex salicifolius]
MATLSFLSVNPFKKPNKSPINHPSLLFPKSSLSSSSSFLIPCLAAKNLGSRRTVVPFYCHCVHTGFPNTTQYEMSRISATLMCDWIFYDGSPDVELRVQLGGTNVEDSKDVYVDANECSLVVGVKSSGSLKILMETNQLYGRIKPGETIWYLDDDQLVITLKKHDAELKWPDIVESWESLNVGVVQLLKGTTIFLVGDSTEINEKVARELAVGLGYTPLDTKGLLEAYTKQSIDSCEYDLKSNNAFDCPKKKGDFVDRLILIMKCIGVASDGSDSVAEAEAAVLESLSSHIRAVVATLGGKEGAARSADRWRHLYAGFTVWLSVSNATDEESAKEEARKQVSDGSEAYSKADVVVKLGGWDPDHAKAVAQASLSALKQLILSDKKLPGKKNLYIRLGCRGDWPDIKPPGWDPAGRSEQPTYTMVTTQDTQTFNKMRLHNIPNMSSSLTALITARATSSTLKGGARIKSEAGTELMGFVRFSVARRNLSNGSPIKSRGISKASTFLLPYINPGLSTTPKV